MVFWSRWKQQLVIQRIINRIDDASTNYVYCVFPFPPSSNGTTWYCDSVSVDRTNATVDYRVTTPYRNGVDIKGTTGQSYTDQWHC